MPIVRLHTPTGIQEVDTDTLTEQERIEMEANLQHHMNEKHIQGLQAWRNWSSLTAAQKDTILKNLLWWALAREGYLEQDEI